jgi:hypothetical protein
VKSVEDEWERELVSDDDLDLLFVSYYPDKITVDEIIKKIAKHGFRATVKEEKKVD